MLGLWEEKIKGKMNTDSPLPVCQEVPVLGMPCVPLVVCIRFHLDTCWTFLAYYWDTWVSNGFSVTSHVI